MNFTQRYLSAICGFVFFAFSFLAGAFKKFLIIKEFGFKKFKGLSVFMFVLSRGATKTHGKSTVTR